MSFLLTPTQRPLADHPSAPAEELPAALEELRAAALGRLSANLAHELRNTLTGVRCCLELLPPTSPEQPLPIHGDVAEVPQGPGLGVEIDEAKAARLAMRLAFE